MNFNIKKIPVLMVLYFASTNCISQENINSYMHTLNNEETLNPPSPRLSGIHEFNNKPQAISGPVIVQQAQPTQDLNRCTQDGGVLTCFNHPHDPRSLHRNFDIRKKFTP